jgi:signal transduction histidine kinase
VVFAWDEEQTRVVPRVSHGFSQKTLNAMKFARGEGIVGRVLETGEPVIVPDIVIEDLRPDMREAIIEEGVHSFVHLPIKVDGQVIAVFNIGFTKPNAANEDIVRLFTALVQRASLSIANMQLFEQTRDLAVMEERNRLARDLHDSAKQKAFAALAQLGTANGILNRNQAGIKPHIVEAENLVYEVIQELSFLIQEIYPMALQAKGLPTSLREYIFEWENRTDIPVELDIQDARPLELKTEQAIYRIIQEALANIARHSRATRGNVSLVYRSDSLEVTIADNGVGFDVGQMNGGMGLRSIRERVGSIRGVMQIQSAPDAGTRVLIQVPLKKTEMEKIR